MTYCLGMENPFKRTIISHLNQIKFGEPFHVFSVIVIIMMLLILGI